MSWNWCAWWHPERSHRASREGEIVQERWKEKASSCWKSMKSIQVQHGAPCPWWSFDCFRSDGYFIVFLCVPSIDSESGCSMHVGKSIVLSSVDERSVVFRERARTVTQDRLYRSRQIDILWIAFVQHARRTRWRNERLERKWEQLSFKQLSTKRDKRSLLPFIEGTNQCQWYNWRPSVGCFHLLNIGQIEINVDHRCLNECSMAS